MSGKALTVAIHQPGYHRHLYYFAKMMSADVFVSLDTVQYVAREWQNRQVFVEHGRRRWLTLPVRGGREPLRDKRLADPQQLARHWRTLVGIYRRAPYFDCYEPALAEIHGRDWVLLTEVCDALTGLARKILGIRTPYLRAHELLPDEGAGRAQLLGGLCLAAGRAVGWTASLTYVACASPMRPDHYLLQPQPDDATRTGAQVLGDSGIDLSTFRYRHPVYRQHQLRAGAPFQSELSIYDLIFNHGPAASDILSAAVATAASTAPVDPPVGLR